jgi:hypothetical protein
MRGARKYLTLTAVGLSLVLAAQTAARTDDGVAVQNLQAEALGQPLETAPSQNAGKDTTVSEKDLSNAATAEQIMKMVEPVLDPGVLEGLAANTPWAPAT